MGLRRRFEREWRAALRQVADAAAAGGQVNRATRVNAVVVHNRGGSSASASAEQTAPIVQGPSQAAEEKSAGEQHRDPASADPGGGAVR